MQLPLLHHHLVMGNIFYSLLYPLTFQNPDLIWSEYSSQYLGEMLALYIPPEFLA